MNVLFSLHELTAFVNFTQIANSCHRVVLAIGNVSDYVYSERRLLIEFSLSSRILVYSDLLSMLQGNGP